MAKWLTAFLALALLATAPAFASQERINASIARLKLTPDETPEFDKILKAHYASMGAMISREMDSVSSEDLSKDVDRHARFINEKTANKMEKVLRPDQMDELHYLLNLIADDFKAQNGIKD